MLGEQVLLFANYFPVNFPKDLTIHRYQINVLGLDNQHDKVPTKQLNKQPHQHDAQTNAQPNAKPDRQQNGLRRRLIELLIEQHLVDDKPFIATDFAEVLVSTRQLRPEIYRVQIGGDRVHQDQWYHVELTPPVSLSASKLLDYVRSSHISKEYTVKEELLEAVNIIVNFHLRNRRNVVYKFAPSRSFEVTTTDCSDLGSGLKAIRGYCTSVRTATQRVLLNIQVIHIAVRPREPVSLDAMIKNFQGVYPGQLLRLEAFLRGFRVEKRHLQRGSYCPRRLISGLARTDDGIGLAHPPIVRDFGAHAKDVQFWQEDKFNQSAGRFITVYEFFQENHQRALTDDCPVVNGKSSLLD